MSGISFPHYRHIVNPKLKYIYLSFDNQGQLIVKSPKVTQREIERVLIKKARWIEDSRDKISQKRGKPLQGDDEEKLYYFGIEYNVDYITQDKSSIIFSKEKGFSIYGREFDMDSINRSVDKFYKNKAKYHLPIIVDKYANQMRLYPTKLSFRKAKRQWGSCSSKNAISLNYSMVKLPIYIIEYIIVHELAHIKYKHHQKSFWELVSKYIPNYKSLQKELKNYTL
jgi:predicted metal-dependent hydrolase